MFFFCFPHNFKYSIHSFIPWCFWCYWWCFGVDAPWIRQIYSLNPLERLLFAKSLSKKEWLRTFEIKIPFSTSVCPFSSQLVLIRQFGWDMIFHKVSLFFLCIQTERLFRILLFQVNVTFYVEFSKSIQLLLTFSTRWQSLIVNRDSFQ